MKVGLSVPRDLVDKIDGQRGDVTRSRYIARMLESSLGHEFHKAPKNQTIEVMD